MERLNSFYRDLGPVPLPAMLGRQCYMHSFDIANPIMKPGYEDYAEPVTALLAAAGITSGIAHMTVDEKVIKAGMSQRRPGPHVDGCFIPRQQVWGHGGGGGGWLHGCNNVAAESLGRMPVIVAASVPGCKAWVGEFDGTPKDDGDLSHLDLSEGTLLAANRGYLLSPDCIHESVRFDRETARVFLRIALPNTFAAVDPQGGTSNA